jgi:hypothetical protein
LTEPSRKLNGRSAAEVYLLTKNLATYPNRSHCQKSGLLGLAQAFEPPDAAAVGVESINVVDDDELVAVAVELHTHSERGGAALDPGFR